jgi:hypothetical protein
MAQTTDQEKVAKKWMDASVSHGAAAASLAEHQRIYVDIVRTRGENSDSAKRLAAKIEILQQAERAAKAAWDACELPDEGYFDSI